MPSFDTFKRVQTSYGNTLGQIHKKNSDLAMEMTWDSNIQSKLCYIYDYYHDDQPNKNTGMTYENTTKTPIMAKFIITQYGSIDKDQVAYHIQFKPSQKTHFSESDDLYYFENYRETYNTIFPISMYVDIPNEEDIYERWMVFSKEQGNQFIKYTVIPCDYNLQWIEHTGSQRIRRHMWCATRSMNSYNTGLFIDRYFNSLDDVQKLWLPLNDITERISYLNANGTNMRFIVSALCDKPLTWKVSKIENTKPIGIIKITLDQDIFNKSVDFIDRKTKEMYADYYSSNLHPIEDDKEVSNSRNCQIETTSNLIKIGGSYKTLSAIMMDNNNDITNTIDDFIWNFSIDGEELDSAIIKVLNHDDKNKIKVKFLGNRQYLGKVIDVKCTVSDIVGELQLQISI